MYIENRLASALFKLLIGVLSAVGFWIAVATLGSSAGRLLSTWVLAISAVYFLVAAAIIAFSKERNAGDIPCPTLEGAILINFLLCGITAICLIMSGEHFPGLSGLPMPLVYATLPILVLCDWAIFNRKGRWHVADPCYWLALPAFYVGYIIYTAEWAPDTLALRYPFHFFEYNEIGITQFLIWLVIFAASLLVGGYIFFIIDYILGGHFSKCLATIRQKKSSSKGADKSETSSEPDDSPEKYTAVKIEPFGSHRGQNVDGIKRHNHSNK